MARGRRFIDDMLSFGAWDEAGFRSWVSAQRIAGMEIESAVRAMVGVAAG